MWVGEGPEDLVQDAQSGAQKDHGLSPKEFLSAETSVTAPHCFVSHNMKIARNRTSSILQLGSSQ